MKRNLIIIGVIVILAAGLWLYFQSGQAPSVPPGVATSTSVTYSNTAYGFSVNLPPDWAGYAVDHKEWSGQIFGKNGVTRKTDSGAQIEISAPVSANDLQPIPVMVFTHAQWNLVLAGQDSTSTEFMVVSAAPVPPMKLGENSKYVFAIPARYNFAFPLGFEKTNAIIKDRFVWSFFEPAGISFVFPKAGDVWNIGQTYRVSWLGGGDKITLFLINKNLAQTAGQSVSITDRFYNIPNTGYYDYTVKQDPAGRYSWSVTDLVQSATSSYFKIQ